MKVGKKKKEEKEKKEKEDRGTAFITTKLIRDPLAGLKELLPLITIDYYLNVCNLEL